MNNKVLVFFVFIAAWGLSSCKDKDTPPPASSYAAVIVVNATADTLNYYINGTRQNITSFIYPDGATVYANALAGTQNYQFKKASRPQVLFSKSFTLDSGQYYSIFLGGVSADNTFIISDALGNASTLINDTTAVIRFVNVAPNSGTLSLVVNAGDTINYKDAAYKTASPFMAIRAGIPQIIKIYQNGSSTPTVDTTFIVQASTAYTIYTTAVPGSTVNTVFNTALLTNN
jgi:hypothetical protein